MIIVILICLIYFLIIVWFISGFLKKTEPDLPHRPFLSVIIAARNEEKNLDKCLQALILQNYPEQKYEIVLINDRSRDETEKIIQAWRERFKYFKTKTINTVPSGYFPKKYALSTGIKISKGDILCFTDADCIPGPDWLQTIAEAYSPNTTLVVGIAPLIPATPIKSPLWQKWLVYESWFLAFTSIAAINNGFPLTCTGRNLSYRKDFFLKLNGFEEIAHSLSGDDDLFMHQIQKSFPGSIATITAPNSIVISQTPETSRQLWRQKIRHISAGKYYPFRKKLFYGVWNMSNLTALFFPVFALIFQLMPTLNAVIILSTKLILDLIFHWIGFKRYGKQYLLKYFLFFEFIYPFYIFTIGAVGLIKKPEW